MAKMMRGIKDGATILVDPTDRQSRPKEKRYADWTSFADKLTTSLRKRLKDEHGIEISELEAYKFACWSMEQAVARVHWAMDGDPMLLDLIRSSAVDAYDRYVAHVKGAFAPPRGERFESPQELEDKINAKAPTAKAPAAHTGGTEYRYDPRSNGGYM